VAKIFDARIIDRPLRATYLKIDRRKPMTFKEWKAKKKLELEESKKASQLRIQELELEKANMDKAELERSIAELLV
jgi:hypothetical protein